MITIMVRALKLNFNVYLMEAICLGLFMISASFFGTLLEYPESPIHQAITSSFLRLCLMGLAMGATAALLNYSPMGKLSGAHMNPAVSFTFVRLGKMNTVDAVYYTLFQCAGGILAVTIMTYVLGNAFQDTPVNYVITAPGNPEPAMAFIAEVTIAFFMMMMVLITTNHEKFSKYTGAIAGFFVMSYVILTGPVSGFGMNPARTLASAIPAMQFPSLWIYMIAPFIGMFSAAALYKRVKGAVICAKMHHSEFYKCIFDCGYCTHDSSVAAKGKNNGRGF
jgi:aquaporin Z